MLEVELAVLVQHGTIMMPAGLPGYERTCTSPDDEALNDVGIGPGLLLSLPELQLYLRLHDYYMGNSTFPAQKTDA